MKLTIDIDANLRKMCMLWAIAHGLSPNTWGNYNSGEAVEMVLKRFFEERQGHEQNA